MPSPISIIPAKISKFLVGKFFNFPPSLKPKSELMKVITVINIAGFRILFPDSKREIPAEKASMLVAIPIKSRHIIPIQHGSFLFLSKASFINFSPKNTKIVNTIALA